jgi:hypothetical protein
MSTPRLLPALLLALASTAGCASSPRVKAPASETATIDTTGAPTPRRSATRRSSTLITRDELLEPSISGASALEAVRLLRPTFLTYRGANSIRDPSAGVVRASIDGGRVVPVDDLQSIRVLEVRSIRFLSASDATQRFGVAAGGSPVILVERM